jgi:hypothetical protein
LYCSTVVCVPNKKSNPKAAAKASQFINAFKRLKLVVEYEVRASAVRGRANSHALRAHGKCSALRIFRRERRLRQPIGCEAPNFVRGSAGRLPMRSFPIA